MRFLQRLLGIEASPEKAATRRARPAGRRLGLESLEHRQLMAVNVINGDLYITAPDGYNVFRGDDVKVEYGAAAGSFKVTENGQVTTVFGVTGGDIVFMGNNTYGDRFENLTALRSQAYGRGGNDVLIGGSSVDELHGGSGNDALYGMLGEDYLYGEGGNDTLIAGYDASYN